MQTQSNILILPKKIFWKYHNQICGGVMYREIGDLVLMLQVGPNHNFTILRNNEEKIANKHHEKNTNMPDRSYNPV